MRTFHIQDSLKKRKRIEREGRDKKEKIFKRKKFHTRVIICNSLFANHKCFAIQQHCLRECTLKPSETKQTNQIKQNNNTTNQTQLTQHTNHNNDATIIQASQHTTITQQHNVPRYLRRTKPSTAHQTQTTSFCCVVVLVLVLSWFESKKSLSNNSTTSHQITISIALSLPKQVTYVVVC